MAKPRNRAHGVKRVPGLMNNTEAAYSHELERQRIAGQIYRWDFEPEKFKLAEKCWLTPDFRVMLSDGEITWHEVKGFMMEDAWIKLKVAAALHPYRFFLVRRDKTNRGAWIVTAVEVP